MRGTSTNGMIHMAWLMVLASIAAGCGSDDKFTEVSIVDGDADADGDSVRTVMKTAIRIFRTGNLLQEIGTDTGSLRWAKWKGEPLQR